MTHGIFLTGQEIEMVYFALNAYALKYSNASHTFGSRNKYQDGPDYAERKAKDITRLQVKFGEILFDTTTLQEYENILTQ